MRIAPHASGYDLDSLGKTGSVESERWNDRNMNDDPCPALMLDDTLGGLTADSPEKPVSCAESGVAVDFDRFLNLQRDALVAFLRKRLSREEDAQDAVQESMLRLLRYREAAPADEWRPLLYRIAANVANDQARYGASRKVNAHVSYDDAFLAQPSLDSPHDERLIHQQAMDKLWRLIRKLPDRTQEIYVLNRIEGMTFEEVARHCGVSSSTVEKHVARALVAISHGRGDIDWIA